MEADREVLQMVVAAVSAERLMEHIAAVETVDHPTDKELVAHARTYFHVQAPRASEQPR